MGRKSTAIEWINHPAVTIHILDTDKFWYGITDKNGNPYTKKREYEGFNATVIQGNHKITDQCMYVSNNFKIWSCKAYAAGKVSSISIPNEYVTVIIHK